MSLTIVNKVRALKKQQAKRRKGKTKSVNFSQYADKPVEFAIEVLGVKFLTPDQKRILESIRDRSVTNVQAGHGIGKTYLMSIVITWWVFAVRGLAFSTAPNLDQVKDLLWREVRSLYDANKKKLGGSRTELSMKYSEAARAKGFAARNYDSNSFQGKHAEFLLILIDEADGITDVIDESFESCLTGDRNRGVRIGNPLDSGTAFARACALDCISIPVWSHPNVAWAYVPHPNPEDSNRPIYKLRPDVAAAILKPIEQRKDDPVKPESEWPDWCQRDVVVGAVSIRWIERMRVKHSEKSAFWISRLDAKRPTDSADGFIPLSWLLEARTRFDSNPDYWEYQASLYPWRIGIDVADGGGDNHCIAIWKGPVLFSVELIVPLNDRQDTLRLAKIASDKFKNLGGDIMAAVDNTGVGAGTLAKLIELGWHSVGCKFGEGADDRSDFTNRKSELHWLFREKLRLGEYAIAPLSNQDYVFQDLSATRYITDTKGRIGCEPKAKTVARLKRSPDSEAVVIALENSMGLMVQPTSIQVVQSTEEYLPSRYYEDGSLAKLKREFRV